MNTNEEYFDRYLRDEMDDWEREVFEERLSADSTFRQAFHQHRALLKQLKTTVEAEDLRRHLTDVHRHMIRDRSKQKGKKLRRSIHFHTTTMLVAASVAMIIVVGTILTINYIDSFKTQKAEYIRLRREVAQIQRSQRAVIASIADTKKDQITRSFTGTGFLLNNEGHILTCYHLVRNQQSMTIENERFGSLKASLLRYDAASDLALLQIEDSLFSKAETVPMVICERGSQLGEQVYTLGYPKADIVYSEGVVSSNSGFFGDTTSYQISIPLNPGNSGGPLINTAGCIVGIINGKNVTEESAAFALKSGYLRHFIEDSTGTTAAVPAVWGKSSKLTRLSRPQQIEALADYVFEIKVYEN